MYNFYTITYDPEKNRKNIEKHGIALADAENFDFVTAIFKEDTRKNYGETRIVALGKLDNRIHVLVFTETIFGIRAISFRKANSREVKTYEHKTSGI